MGGKFSGKEGIFIRRTGTAAKQQKYFLHKKSPCSQAATRVYYVTNISQSPLKNELPFSMVLQKITKKEGFFIRKRRIFYSAKKNQNLHE